jgi:hypothetical protein
MRQKRSVGKALCDLREFNSPLVWNELEDRYTFAELPWKLPLGWAQEQRLPSDWAQAFALPRELKDALGAAPSPPLLQPVLSPTTSRLLPTTGVVSSNRIEPKLESNEKELSSFESNPERNRVLPHGHDARGASARDYIEEKLCVPRLAQLRVEVTGGDRFMTHKFAQCMQKHPEVLKDIIADAATPAIQNPVKFVNAKMTQLLM